MHRFLNTTFILFLGLLNMVCAENQVRESLITKALHPIPESQWWDLDTPVSESKEEALEELLEKIRKLPSVQVHTFAAKVLKPRLGQFVPISILDKMVRKLVYTQEAEDYSSGRISMSRSLADYVAFHWKNRDKQRESSNQALYYHLLFLSERFQTSLLREVILVGDFPAPMKKKPQTIKLSMTRGPEENPGPVDSFWRLDQVIESAGALFAPQKSEILKFDPKTGTTEMIAPPREAKGASSLSLLAGDKDTLYMSDSSQNYMLKSKDNRWIFIGNDMDTSRYYVFTAIKSGLISFFAPQPHFFGAVEKSPFLLEKNPEFLDTKLLYWDQSKRAGQKLNASNQLPFLGSVGMKNHCFCLSSTASGKLALGLYNYEVKYPPYEPEPASVFIAKTEYPTGGFVETLKHFGEASFQPGFTADQIIFMPKAAEPEDLSEEGYLPTCCLLFDPEDNSLKQLFQRDQPYDKDSWAMVGYDRPKTSKWELPVEFNAPSPNTQTRWHRVFLKENQLVAFVSQWHVGRESEPRFSLLVFSEGRKFPEQIELDFELNDELLQRLSEGGYVGSCPTPVHQIFPKAYDCDTMLTFFSYFGIWTISWDHVLGQKE